MENEENIEIGVNMEAYDTKGELVEFKLIDSEEKNLYKTNSGELYQVLGKLDKKDGRGKRVYYLIEFGNKVRLVVRSSSVFTGAIKNPCTPSVFDRGFLGQGVYSVIGHPREHKTWCNMIRRCYSEIYHRSRPTYIGCSVSERWFNFQNFCEDITSLEGYKEWKENIISRKYTLDKDIKVEDNKIYSKATCIFVTNFENNSKAHLSGKTYLATFLETGYEEEFSNQSLFAKAKGLNSKNINKCLMGNQKTSKGWSFKTLGD